MKPVTEQMIRAAIALQVAALEWDQEGSLGAPPERAAVTAMKKAILLADSAVVTMSRLTAARDRDAQGG